MHHHMMVAETYAEGAVIDTLGKAVALLGTTDKGGNPTSILASALAWHTRSPVRIHSSTLSL